MASRSRRIIYLCLTIAGVLAAILLILEGGARIYVAASPKAASLARISRSASGFEDARSLPELLEKTPVGFAPGKPVYDFRLNSKSLHTHEYRTAKPPETKRVLVFGDSFTFSSGGVPYDHLWTTLLDQQLNARLGEPVELLNFGVSATGTGFQLRLWELEGSKLDPDLVILAFCVGNDFTDEIETGPENSAWTQRLARTSLFVRLVKNLYRLRTGLEQQAGEERIPESVAAKKNIGQPIPGYAYDPNAPNFDPETFAAIMGIRMDIYVKKARPRFNRLFAETAAKIEAFRNQVEASGSKFLLLMIPEEWQVYPKIAALGAESAGRSVSDYDLDLPQRRLKAWCSKNKVKWFDLLPGFRRNASKSYLYKKRDSHFNEAGCALTARLVAPRAAALLEK